MKMEPFKFSLAETLRDEYENALQRFEKALLTLKEKERLVLISRFGLSGQKFTQKECGYIFGVSTERIRQIEAKALRKMAHPSKIKFITGESDSL